MRQHDWGVSLRTMEHSPWAGKEKSLFLSVGFFRKVWYNN